MMNDIPPVCDYEGSDYRTRFWENGGRDYENLVERIALHRLMPAHGSTLIDIGAGFGRLADEYDGYEKVVLFDYSSSLLREGRERLGNDPRFIFVAGNWYDMPFVDNVFETMVQVRTMHHAAEPERLLKELSRIARPMGHYVLEFANKRNIKSILRYALKKQEWSPHTEEPIEFVELNYDFHPVWMNRELKKSGFAPGTRLSVSHFRIGLLKKLIPTALLVHADSLIQRTGKWWQLTPSVFVLNRHPITGTPASPDLFFACPSCKAPLDLATAEATEMACSCGKTWIQDRGVWNFKQSKEEMA